MNSSRKKISIRDIAAELNLSITTVSFVINGKSKQKGISVATTKKVNELIKKRGFYPNLAARMLRTGKSKTIGLIVEDISNNFFGRIAKTIETEAHKSGYNVFFSSTENEDTMAIELINKMKNSSVDGYIITATTGLKNELEKLKKEHIPFVLLDRMIPGIEANYIILDNYQGGYDLTKHLLCNGYSKIGFVTIVDGMSQMFDREKGFKDAMADAKITVTEEKILKVPFKETDENNIGIIRNYLAKNPDLDALFFATNYLGVLGIEALQQANVSIPSDIAIVSFDDNDLFRVFTPSVTVASQPIKEIATRAIGLLIKMINKGQKPNKVIGEIIKPVIIKRDSSPKKISKLMRPVKVLSKQ